MKKNDVIIPITLAGIILILVIVSAVTKKDFMRSPAETLQIANENRYLIGPGTLSTIPTAQLVVFKIGVGKLPTFSYAIEVKEIDFGQLLSTETKALLSDNKKKKILFSLNLDEAVKTWTFLTRMGYNELYVYDADAKNPSSQADSILHGNEEMHYTFKPAKTEAQ
jgi:hypothetical protein